MKNPFVKQNNGDWWIAGAITGALAATAGILYYLQRKRAAELAAYKHEHAQDYLKDRASNKLKHQSDVEDLHWIAAN